MDKRFDEFKKIMQSLGYNVFISDVSVFETEEDMLETLPIIVELNKIGVDLPEGYYDSIKLCLIGALIYYNAEYQFKLSNLARFDEFVSNIQSGVDDDFCSREVTVKALLQFKRYMGAFNYSNVLDFNSLAKCIAYQLTGKEFNFNSSDIISTVKMFKSDCYISSVKDCRGTHISYLVDGATNSVIGYRVKFDNKVRDIDLSQLFRLRTSLIGVQTSVKCTLENGVYISEKEKIRGRKIRKITSIELEHLLNDVLKS